MTVAELRERGYLTQVVEHWVPRVNIRRDLFQCIDVVALSPDGETIGVQATSLANVAARIDKIATCEALPWLRRCGWRVLVFGWGKDADGRIRLREVPIP